MSVIVGKTPPHRIEAEENLLSCCFLDGAEVVARCIEGKVTPAAFYIPANRVIFEVCLELYAADLPVELDIIADKLKESKRLVGVGGYPYLTQISKLISTTAKVSYFIAKVREMDGLRNVITKANAAVEKCYDYSGPEDLAEIGALLKDATDTQTAISTTSNGLTLWSPSQFINYLTPAGWSLLGDGYLERGQWTSLVGIGGLGKTRLALRLAIALILGRDWCGLSTNGAPVKALFLSTENGLRRWKTDLGKMMAALSPEECATIDANLSILALTAGTDCDLNLGNDKAVSRLVSTLRSTSPALVILDPFADLVDGDESATADLVSTLRTLAEVHRQGAPEAALLIIHHARTGAANVAQAGDQFNAGNFGRGSKALYSRVRCELQLAPGDRDDASRIVLACGKSNDAPKFKPRGLIFDEETFDYVLDESFDIDAWRQDVNGKRTGNKSVTVADCVEIVRELAPMPGSEVTAGAIQRACKERLDASERTVRARLGEACRLFYLKQPRKGFYRLGSKPLPR